MGSLKPGAKLVYERADNVVYSREFGSDPSSRQVVGWDYDPENPLFDPKAEGKKELDEHNEWIRIRLEAKTNPALQKAVDRVIMIYKLSKDKLP